MFFPEYAIKYGGRGGGGKELRKTIVIKNQVF